DRCGREHAAIAQALCGAASTQAIAEHSRRIHQSMRHSHEKEMDFHRSAGDSRAAAVHRHRWPGGAAAVELAPTATVRLAADYVLASARTARAVPHSLRRIRG